MPFTSRRQHHHTAGTAHTTHSTTTPRRKGIFGRRRAPAHHHKRKPTMKDKVSGALLKLKGSLTHKPGVKAAGTRRMHGTDGRGSHHHM